MMITASSRLVLFCAAIALPAIGGAFCGLSPVRAAWQDLPGEGELPGRTLPLDQLPPESVLPGTAWRDDDDVNRDPPIAALLPEEGELPPLAEPIRSEIDPAADSSPDDIRPADADRVEMEAVEADQDRPWLRLLLDGPTAPLRAVQFSADSRRLLAGGDDKALHVWRYIAADGNLAATWTYEQPILWQVQRGVRGGIRAIAADPQSFFFAGVGATPLTSEIARVDPEALRWDRCLYDLQVNSPGEVASLAVVGPDTLAALDVSGQIVLWRRDPQTGLWQATRVRESDGVGARVESAAALQRYRRFGTTLAGSAQGFLCFAQPIPGADPSAVPNWQIVRREIASGRESTLAASQPHAGSVPAIAISADGQRVVSADLTDAGRWFRWDLRRAAEPTVGQFQAPIRALALSPSGKFLFVGTARNAAGESQAALYQWAPNGDLQPLARWQHAEHILAGCLSPDEQWLAYTQGSQVVIRRVSEPNQTPTLLAATGTHTAGVAFSADPEQPYRVQLAPRRDEAKDADPAPAWIFDPTNPGLVDESPRQPQRWLTAHPQPDRWRLRALETPQSGAITWRVEIDGLSYGDLPLDSNADGLVTASCWVVDPQQPARPLGLVVGTNKSNHIYLYRTAADGALTLLRQYRGHEAAVESLGVSIDRRFLVSSAADSTIRFWKLDDAVQASAEGQASIDAWGARFQVEDEQLVAVDVVLDGPLYYRGVREGDRISGIAWTPAGTTTAQRRELPAEILAELRRPEWRRMLRFETARAGVVQPPFYLHPAWQPLASLLVTADREWAYWSPYGYYDASFNGHKRFGWQFNRGIDRSIDLFRAAELKDSLERPELLRQLLSQGSLSGAFQVLHQSTPLQLQSRLAGENRLRPRIALRAPSPGVEIAEGPLSIAAEIELPRGLILAPPKAFLNGVPAGPATLVGSRDAGDSVAYQYRWQADPPRDRRLRIQVLAASEAGGSDMASCDVSQPAPSGSNRRPPQLYLLAAGVNEYSDGQIPKLDFAVRNVQAFRQALAEPSPPPADNDRTDLQSTLLLGGNVSRSLWRVASQATISQLEQRVQPDDLVVIFLSGHGVSDPATGEYFFVTPTARYTDLMGRQYRDCISLDDFAPWARIPCRKLVILDTCESGTFQGSRQQNLKPLVRWLEDDLFFTLTSAEGAADAYESTEAQLSYFTASLIAGLDGAADQPNSNGERDGRVEWSELAQFVMHDVPAAITRIGKQQYPSAAPRELLEFAEIPLKQ